MRIRTERISKNFLKMECALISYDWPGNVRELENAIERAVVFTHTTVVPLSVLKQIVPALLDTPHSLTFKIGTPWSEVERQAIEIVLAHTRGNKPMAAKLLGIASRTVYRHILNNSREQSSPQAKTEFQDGDDIDEPAGAVKHKSSSAGA